MFVQGSTVILKMSLVSPLFQLSAASRLEIMFSSELLHYILPFSAAVDIWILDPLALKIFSLLMVF